MDNTISINVDNGNNSMNSLSFFWKAVFNDNSEIFQFDIENKIEHKYQEVKDRLNELKCFYLYHKRENLNFKVDLIEGKIIFNEEPKLEVNKEIKNNIRLIYFRTHKVELSEHLKQTAHYIYYNLGFQYLDKNGFNRKIIIIIDEQGSWKLGE